MLFRSLQMLSRVTHYEMDGEQMLLLSNGELLAIFEALPEGEAK